MDWQPSAAALADTSVHYSSQWHAPIAMTPRHLFTPRWWRRVGGNDHWTLQVGADDETRWLSAAYGDRSVVTRVGALHADAASPSDHPLGRPTSSSTLPHLLAAMYDHAVLTPRTQTLCVTGSGYGTALLASRFGHRGITSVDVDAYLVEAAAERLDVIGLRPTMAVCDITGPLPGVYDRIVSTVGLPGIPASWLTGLTQHGRLVTNLAGTGLVIAADRTPDGGARGQVTWQRAGFMATRAGEDYPPGLSTGYAWTAEGEEVSVGRYPVIQVAEAWELMSAVALAAPGVEHSYAVDADGVRTAVMVHADGSWSRATGRRGEQPTVHQGGPRRLWDVLDGIRHDWLSDGSLPVYGASVVIDHDGVLHLSRRGWTATIPPAVPAVRV